MLSFFPLDISDEIWDSIESVSEGVLTYSVEWKKEWQTNNEEKMLDFVPFNLFWFLMPYQ